MELLRGLWPLVDGRALGVVPARELGERVGPDAVRVLRRLRIVRDAPARGSWPCDEVGCAREVRPNAAGARDPFVAVCGRAPACCEPVALSADDVAMVALHGSELTRALQRLFDVSEPIAARASPRAPRAESDGEPVALGVSLRDGQPRDVFLAASLDGKSLARFLELRERVDRASLVLVPTGRRVPSRLAGRHPAGGHVELAILEDAVGLLGDDLARITPRPALRVVASPPPRRTVATEPADGGALPTKAPSGAGITLPRAKEWRDVTFYIVDGHTMRVQVGSANVRVTYIDLGMASAQNRAASSGARIDAIETPRWPRSASSPISAKR
jgi:hypothetical protein